MDIHQSVWTIRTFLKDTNTIVLVLSLCKPVFFHGRVHMLVTNYNSMSFHETIVWNFDRKR